MIRLAAIIAAACGLACGQSTAIDQALSSMGSGRAAEAESILRSELLRHPSNADAVALLAVVEDQEKKYTEAEILYTRAVALNPSDPALLNNYGNHLLAIGKQQQAAQEFRRVLQVAPAHVNARIQLAALALQDKQPVAARKYLAPLPSDVKNSPRVAVLEMQASYEDGHVAEGDAIAGRLRVETKGDLEASLAVASGIYSAGQYRRAEELFAELSKQHPSEPRVAYYLGLTEARTGDDAKASQALERARLLDPKNVSVLYDLAVVQRKLDRRSDALQTLADAAGMEPGRADIQRLLGQTLLELGYFSDAVSALDAYLKLQPHDEQAQRDRAYAESAVGTDLASALAALRSYVRRHPSDAVGYFELAMAQTGTDLGAAGLSLNEAIGREPDFAAAFMARGILQHKKGDDEAAASDFQAVLRMQPRNTRAMEHLALSYSALDRNRDALDWLNKAEALSPNDSAVLLALGRALLKSGDTSQAAQVFKRARELGPVKQDATDGLLAFLKLSPGEQNVRYRAGVERAAQNDPSNVEAQVRYLKILPSSDSKARRTVAEHIVELGPSSATTVEAAGELLSAEEPDLAAIKILIDYGVRQYPADPKISALVEMSAQLAASPVESTVVARSQATQ